MLPWNISHWGDHNRMIKIYFLTAFLCSGGGRRATAIKVFDHTENSFKLTWNSNYQMDGRRLHYIVSLYYNKNILVDQKNTTYYFTPLLFTRAVLSNTPYRIAIQGISPHDNLLGDEVDYPFSTPKGTLCCNKQP